MVDNMQRWFYATAIRLEASSGQTRRVVETCRPLATKRPTTLLAPNNPLYDIPHLASLPVTLPSRPPRELVFQARLLRTILHLAHTHRPDVIFTVAAACNIGAILAARLLHVPCILEINGLPAFEYSLEHHRQTVATRARAAVYTLMERIEHRLADGIVVVTPRLAERVQRNGARHVYVTRNGVDAADFTPLDRHTARDLLRTRHAIDIPADAQLVGYVGTFSLWQGLDTLIEGATLLLRDNPRLHVLLIGDGPELPRLQSLAAPISSHVHFAGRMPHHAVSDALSACDVLAAPFAPIERNQQMGISALKIGEYMALARPILTAQLSGMEMIADERIGALFTAGDATSLATELSHLFVLPPDKLYALGQRARALAETTFSWNSVTDDLIAFAENIPRRT